MIDFLYSHQAENQFRIINRSTANVAIIKMAHLKLKCGTQRASERMVYFHLSLHLLAERETPASRCDIMLLLRFC